MKIKSLLAIFTFFTFLSFISCDDDLNEIGSSIQPPSDLISSIGDTVSLQARTISMRDGVYARTSRPVLGRYEDDLFGTIKSDYLSQFSFSDLKFINTVKSIDSAKITIQYSGYLGDSISPMGLTVYKVTSPLPENFYTNIDPTQYSDMQQVLANEAYTITGSSIINGSTYRLFSAKFDVNLARQLYERIANGSINNNQTLNDFFPGLYITTTLGSNNLIQTSSTILDIHYTYNSVNAAGVSRDTTAIYSLVNTGEGLQLNHISNINPPHLFEEGTGAAYLKTPAGVFTEVTFPISEIAANMERNNMTTINSAQFVLKGYTEREPDPTSNEMLNRPSQLLLIHKDSVDTFFKNRQIYDNTTTYVASRNASNNTYSFGNISSLITTYKNKNIDNVPYVIVPVEIQTIYDQSLQGYRPIAIFNSMSPSSAILRNDADNMRLELIYSKF